MAIEIKPTRSELMKLKKKIVLAKSGYNLLKKKRDGLILDFFEILKDAKTVRKDLTDTYKSALDKINIARTFETDIKLRSIALAIKESPGVEIGTKNLMGVVIPKIKKVEMRKKLLERGYGIASSSSAIDEAAKAYEILVEKIVVAAEIETALKKLLQEIEKTKRRVNALEYSVIPQMEEAKTFVTFRLEEMERENIFRLKRIKA